MQTVILIVVIAVVITAIAFLGGFILLKFALFRRTENDRHTFAELMMNEANTLETRKRIRWFFDKKESGAVKNVEIKSYDGLVLRAMLLRAEKPCGRTVICFHGYTGNGDNEYAPFAEFFYQKGFNLLIPDMRGHSFSEGKFITMGVKDRFDVKSWTEFVLREFGADEKVILHGVSMGAASVMMATELELPRNVRGIVADCGYTTPYDMLKLACRGYYKIPPFPMFYMAELLCSILCGWKFKGASALVAMQKNTAIPVLFVHGEKDSFIPSEMTKANYDACNAPKMLFLSPEANHAESYYKSTDEYEAKMNEFFKLYLN